MSKRDRRLQKRADAAAFLENHSGPVMSMLAQVVEDLAEDNANLTQFEADMALALELGHRLDQAVNFPDPVLEALDNVIASFVALVAIGIYRAACRAEKLRGARLDRLRDRLEKRGPKIAAISRRHLERRIKRLQEKAGSG